MDKKKKERNSRSAYDTALSYLSPRARTAREVELKLDEGDYSEAEIMYAIERLINAGLLDDKKYAHDFIESRLNTKPVSKFRLSSQLQAHHVPKDIIEEAIAELPEEGELQNAAAVIKKYMRQFEKIDDVDEKKRRVYARLSARGYSHDTIMAAMEEYCNTGGIEK